MRKFLFFAGILFCTFSAFSQIKSEEDLKKQAAKAFEDEEYATGFKLYSQLVSNYPKDPEHNYRLGVCMIFSDPDKKKCMQYLKFAVDHIKDAEKEAYFYLGKAYHLNFQFDEAIKYYNLYKLSGASSSMQKKLLVDREMECCKNGKRLLANLTELVILDKKELSQTDYYRSYDLKDIGGKLLVKPADFTSAADKKKKDKSIIYLPADKEKLYYASYGEKSDNKDIYVVNRMASGEWGKPESIGAPVNTAYDEDFPFLHPNGKVLYFASKGHNSMGGYDIFKSELDEGTNKWKAPVNLDFPINSPNDDVLFVTDSLEKIAFLASNRQSAYGRTDVYKILTERRPAEYAFIKGSVIKKSPSQSVRSKISIKSIDNGEDAGTFSADENGVYAIKIANGGKYIFTVETPGFATQSKGVDIPTAYNYKPYKQAIEYEDQKLKITNFFETNDGDENNYAQYLQLIEEKSKMNVNVADFDINPNNPVATSTNTPKNNAESSATNTTTVATNTTSSTPTKTNLKNSELITMANDDAKELQAGADSLKKDAAVAFSAANSKQDQANEKKQEAQDLQNKANAETNPAKKQELTALAEKAKEEADLFANQASTANNIAKQMEVDATNKQKEADLNAQYAKALEEAEKTKNNKQAIAKLEELQKQLEEAANKKSGTNNLVESIKADAQNKEKELQAAEVKQKKLDDIISEFNKQYADLETQEKETKDKGLIENIKAQKEEITTDLNEKQKESKINQDKIATLKDESDALKSQAEYAANVMDGTATNTVSPTVTSNTTTAVATNTVAPTNTVAATNTVTTNENPPAETGFAADAKKFNDDLITLNNSGNNLENNKMKIEVLNQYAEATDKEIKDKKEELKKAKTPAEKTALNKEIKQLTDKKTELDKENKIVSNQIKDQEKQAALAAKNNNTPDTLNGNVSPTNTTSVAETNTTTAVATNTTAPVETNTLSVSNTGNDNPQVKSLNDLQNETQKNAKDEKKVFEDVSYTDPKALQLKKQADEKIALSQKNSTELEKQIEELKNQLTANAGTANQNAETEKKITDIKNKLNKERQSGNAALKLLVDANKAEYLSSFNAYVAEEKKTGSSFDAQEFRTKAENSNKSANTDIAQIPTVREDAKKRELYLSGNSKLEEAITLIRKAKVALTAEENPVATETLTPIFSKTVDISNTPSVTATNTVEPNVAANNTVTPVNTNTVEPVNTNTVEPVATQTTTVATNTVETNVAANNTVTPVNTNTVAPSNTNTITPVATGTLTEERIAEIKNTPEYEKITSLKANINKYSESANNDAERSQDESIKAAKLTEEAAALPPGPEKQKKEQEAAATKQKADSLQEMASNTRALANSKKQELDDYNQTVDKKTMADIEAVSFQAASSENKNADNSSPFTNTTKQLDNQLNDLKGGISTPENIKKQNELLNTYISTIEKEVSDKKKQQAAASDQDEKNKIAQQIKTLQLQKIKLTNERTANENSLRASNNNAVVSNNPPVNNNTNNPPANNNNRGSTNPPSNNTNTSAEKTAKYLNSEGFEIKKGNAYSAGNPIPVDEKLPDGLFFRVQIGAFKNAIPADRFSGLAPVGAETTPSGLVRYQAGMFTKYQTANAVKNDLRKLKYNDAFVVAYRNGKRVSLAEALDTLRKAGDDVSPDANSTAGISTSSNIPVNPEAVAPTAAPVTTSGDLNKMEGAFYTIQIGVYGNNVTAAGLFNLSPVFKDVLPSGYNRYTAGIYSSFERANADKARVNASGIPDAFVGGYVNGKRLAFNVALDNSANNLNFSAERPIIFPAGGNTTNNTQPVVNNTQPANPNVQPFNNGVTEGPAPTENNGVKTSDEGITFKVQIGAYRNQVPADIANTWVKVKTWPIKYAVVNDLYLYTVGSFSEARFAKTLKAEIVALGINDAFVTVFKDGKKLYGTEAAQYLNR